MRQAGSRAEGATQDIIAEDAAIARIVTRLSGEYVLRVVHLLATDFSILDGIVVLTIASANTAHLTPLTEGGRRYASVDAIPPDEVRRPISIARIAETLGMPFETTRRRVQGLMLGRACVRVERGVIVPSAYMARLAPVRMLKHVGYVRKFLRDLGTVGIIGDGGSSAFFPTNADADAAIARMVGRLSAGYVLRAVRLLIETYGDIRLGVVAQTIVTANTAHLDVRTGEGWRYAGIDEAPPDEVRRPISVSRLAESLGLPFETTRGQVRRLIDAGVCIRVEGGLIVPAVVLEGPAAVRAAVVNVGYVRRFVRDLQAVGGLKLDAWSRVRFTLDQNLARLVGRLEEEQDPTARDALRRLFAAEVDRYGALTERLEAADRVIAECEQRISATLLLLWRLSKLGSDAETIGQGEQRLANLHDALAMARDCRQRVP
jgi:DNA-binding Lrp family transcriptional regulator